MSNKQTPKPRPCWFCGGETEVRKLDLSNIEEGWQLYGVFCKDDLCAEEHGGYQHGHYIDNYATEAEAVEAWNRHATLERGTCTMKKLERFDGDDPAYQCSECRHENYESEVPNYCPHCGKRIEHD